MKASASWFRINVVIYCVFVYFPSSGWQPRWFVLENGVISYYDSEDDVGKGSKGSIKMSVCDIKG
uniref:PH domain-containing protein n=1 Tax=Myripristis murdjan TaxID=586833 RepID=A0A667XJM0_9TELE